MPNNTSIELTVSGDAKVLELFVASHIVDVSEDEQVAWSPSAQHFDFNTIIPEPTLYNRNSFSVNGRGAGLYGGKWKEQDEELPAMLKEKYGHEDWYGWRISNWGVKWNSYDNNINTDFGTGEVGSIQIEFQTAWTIPEGIFLELMELYPELVFEVECLEEGGGFAGYICYEDGFADESQLFTDTESWQKQASKMLGCEFDENGDLI